MTNAPKIYNWQEGPLSIAQFYGGIKIEGVRYTIDTTDPDMPLVRDGVKTHEQIRDELLAAVNRYQQARAKQAQGVLL